MTVVRAVTRHRLADERLRRKPVMMFLSEQELETLDRESGTLGMPRATYIRWRLLYGGRRPRGPGGASGGGLPPAQRRE